MKMKRNKLISSLLVIAILMANLLVFSLTVFADDSVTLYLDQYYSTHYFSKLNKYGYNVKGSCGYISAAMLLGYYDTYQNDNVINYDATAGVDHTLDKDFDGLTTSTTLTPTDVLSFNAPGTAVKSGASSNMTALDYLEFVLENRYDAFDLYLISIGVELNYYNGSDNATPCGLTMPKLKNVIETYLDRVELSNSNSLSDYIGVNFYSYDQEIDSGDGTSEELTDEGVLEMASQLISSGTPVIISGTNPTVGSHAMIAYDVDSNGTIYVNPAHPDFDSNHIALESTGYTENLEIMYLDVDLAHACSDNYHWFNWNTHETLSFCPCVSNLHYAHVHTQPCGSTTPCICGELISHDYTYTHTPTRHTGICLECGDTVSGVHVVERNAPIKVCLVCRRIIKPTDTAIIEGIEGDASLMTIINDITYITENGSYVLPSGIIVLTEEDVELFLAGQLNIYS